MLTRGTARFRLFCIMRNHTDKGRLAAVVDVEQIAVQVQVLVTAILNRRVRGLGGIRAGRKVEAGIKAPGRHGHLGEALGLELGFVDDDLLDLGVGGLNPVRRERGHCV